MSDLNEYQDLIDKKAEENSTDVLPNAGEKHAAIVMAKMFDKTSESANMIVGSFEGPVSDQENYLLSLKGCVEKKIPFKIIFLDTPNESSEAYQFLKQKKNEGYPIIFKSAEPNLKEKLNKKYPIHFSVFDNNKYRFEKDTKNYLASVCFNDKENATALNKIFIPAFDKSPEI